MAANQPDSEDKLRQKNLKYPRSVFFIVSNEFCERFCYYGMKTVLSLYLTSVLKYDDDEATVWYHIFNMLCYFFPLVGAIIADSYLGKYKTIVSLSLLYSVGNIVLAVSSATILHFPQRVSALIALLFIAIGTGGIKPCVCPFGGDQFKLPEQEKQLERYFSIFYFSINAGSLISTALTPVLREDVTCFGDSTCFPLAFGVPGILMIASVLVFIIGTPLYKRKDPEGNIIVTVVGCILNAVRNKITSISETGKEHWLDYSSDKYSNQQISDIKAVLNVLFLFIPLPLFWALFDQQGSRWTFQAVNMDGRIFSYNIKPDQMQVLNPLLILTFIPLFETCFYPILRKFGIRRALQKLTLGGILASAAFVMSAILEFELQKTYPVLAEKGEGQVRFFNSLDCNLTFTPPFNGILGVYALDDYEYVRCDLNKVDPFVTSVTADCPRILKPTNASIHMEEYKSFSYFFTQRDGAIEVVQSSEPDNLAKDSKGFPKIRIFFGGPIDNTTAEVTFKQGPEVTNKTVTSNAYPTFFSLYYGSYDINLNGKLIKQNIYFGPGSIHTILIRDSKVKVIEMIGENSVHMLWQFPQIITITAGEILFSVTGLEFSFTQAPESMKSVLSSAWLLTVAFGNLIVVIVSEIKIFKSQAYEFLLFAVLMLGDMGVFIIMAIRYKYVDYSNSQTTVFEDESSSKTEHVT